MSVLPASVQAFDGRTNVPAEFVIDDPMALHTRRSGLVTTSTLVPGALIESGAVVMTVDDDPVVALATSQPLHRDLAVGDKGPDVTALQESLVALGYFKGQPSGVFGTSTSDAVRAMKRQLGLPNPRDGGFRVDSYIWLPAAPFRVATLEVHVGQTVEAGSALATQGGVLSRIALDIPADYPAEGHELNVEIFGVAVPIDGPGAVTAVDSLEAVSSSLDFQRAASVPNGLDGSIAVVRYQQPIEALRVPVAALYSVSGTRACLSADGQARQVEIVSSSLSGTLVFTDGWNPKEVDVARAVPGRACTAG